MPASRIARPTWRSARASARGKASRRPNPIANRRGGVAIRSSQLQAQGSAHTTTRPACSPCGWSRRPGHQPARPARPAARVRSTDHHSAIPDGGRVEGLPAPGDRGDHTAGPALGRATTRGTTRAGPKPAPDQRDVPMDQARAGPRRSGPTRRTRPVLDHDGLDRCAGPGPCWTTTKRLPSPARHMSALELAWSRGPRTPQWLRWLMGTVAEPTRRGHRRALPISGSHWVARR
jgi:hypothetical protein